MQNIETDIIIEYCKLWRYKIGSIIILVYYVWLNLS